MLSIYSGGTLWFPQPPSRTRVISSDRAYEQLTVIGMIKTFHRKDHIFS
jgi:hypothetical protein